VNPFAYTRPADVATAIREIAGDGASALIAGGTNLLDLMKEHVERPSRLIDIGDLPLRDIEPVDGGGWRLGALATNTEVAYHPEIARRYPLLARAILAGASAQLRNMATLGGNLMQRTRCAYFYDTATPCNKRTPGAGCSAIAGYNRYHAILGASEHCIAVHPSDLCVALAALEAVVRVTGPGGERAIPFPDFHRLPEDRPHVDTDKRPNEIITAVDLPADGFAGHSAYLKVRDRTSYAFALVSVAAALRIEAGTIRAARLALGGVAHRPWRDRAVEAALVGQPVSREAFARAGAMLVREARGFTHNAFKIELTRSAVVRALEDATARPARL
jgi:xanthine dehydrogenase YagS FAD-binding subunit